MTIACFQIANGCRRKMTQMIKSIMILLVTLGITNTTDLMIIVTTMILIGLHLVMMRRMTVLWAMVRLLEI